MYVCVCVRVFVDMCLCVISLAKRVQKVAADLMMSSSDLPQGNKFSCHHHLQ